MATPTKEDLASRLNKFIEEQRELKVRAEVKLRFKPSLLRVGRGFEAGAVAMLNTLTVLHEGRENPIIPESSWRGVLRSIGESIAKASSFNDAVEDELVRAHFEPEEGPTLHLIDDDFRSELRKLVEDPNLDRLTSRFVTSDELRRVARPRPEALEPLLTPLCPLCRLFGGPGLRSKLVIYDSILSEAQLHHRTHVSINREAGVREEERLFTVEYAAPNQVELEMVVDNVLPSTSEAKILAGLLQWIRELGVEVGGFKSRGVGHLTLKVEKSEVLYLDFNSVAPSQLARALVKFEDEAKPMKLDDYIVKLRGVQPQ